MLRKFAVRFNLVLVLTVLFCGFEVSHSFSQQLQPEQSFIDLRTRYFRLRNTDPDLTRPQEWIGLVAEFEQFVSSSPASASAPKALLSAASLVKQLSQKYGRSSDQERVVQLLRRIIQQYPESTICDQALLDLGDFLTTQLGQQQQAQQAYSTVLERDRSIETVIVARERLRRLQGGGTKVGPAEQSTSQVPGPSRRQGQKVIVIDPGHGGDDVGAEGIVGLLEKDVVLDIALRLEKILSTRSDLLVHLTRRTDIFMPLAERTKIANQLEADLFISLHTNASIGARLQGLESYYLDNTDDQASRKLAERENRFSGRGTDLGSFDLQFMLSDLIQETKRDDSIALANKLQRSLLHSVKRRHPEVKDLGVKKAPFYVLVGAHMPCVLLELLFIDHPKEGALLATEEFRQELAAGIYSGIDLFLAARH